MNERTNQTKSLGRVGPIEVATNLREPMDLPEIPRMLVLISELQDESGKMLEQLHNRLGPVMRNEAEPQDDDLGKVGTCQTEVGQRLEGLAERVRTLNRDLLSLYRQVEL